MASGGFSSGSNKIPQKSVSDCSLTEHPSFPFCAVAVRTERLDVRITPQLPVIPSSLVEVHDAIVTFSIENIGGSFDISKENAPP